MKLEVYQGVQQPNEKQLELHHKILTRISKTIWWISCIAWSDWQKVLLWQNVASAFDMETHFKPMQNLIFDAIIGPYYTIIGD